MLAFATGNPSSVQRNDRGGAWVWIAPERADGKGQTLSLGNNSDGPVADIAFSPDGKLIAVAGFRKLDAMKLGHKPDPKKDGVWEGTVQVFETETLKPRYQGTVKGPAQSVAFDRRGERLVVASGDRNNTYPDLWGQVVVVDLKDSQKIARTDMEDCDDPSVRAAFSPDGRVVVSGGSDGIGRVHNPETGQLLATLVGHAAADHRPRLQPRRHTPGHRQRRPYCAGLEPRLVVPQEGGRNVAPVVVVRGDTGRAQGRTALGGVQPRRQPGAHWRLMIATSMSGMHRPANAW